MRKDKDSEKIFLTADEAISLLKGSHIHTFRNSPMMLIGADWSKKSLVKLLKEVPPDSIEIGGEQCRKMGHGLVVWTSENDPLFVQVDDNKLTELENQAV